jgi:hypothetical protein
VITAGRISKAISEIRQHGFHYPGIAGSSGIMVKINGKIQHIFSLILLLLRRYKINLFTRHFKTILSRFNSFTEFATVP